MAIQDDWTIDYGAETVTHTSGTTVYTVLEFFQWLAATFASRAQMDDEYPIVSDTPTVFRWINGWGFGTPSTDYRFLSGGSITSSDGQEEWANLYTIGSQVSGTQIYLIQNDLELSPYWPAGNIDVLVLIRTSGSLIDNGNVLVLAREFGDEYDHSSVDLSGGGRNPVGINTTADNDNTTAEATVATYTDISITFGTISRNLNNGNGSKDYDVEIDGAGRPIIEVYEYLKYVTRHNSSTSLNSTDGEQYLSANEGTYIDVKKSPFGTFAGGTFFGARGVWITNVASSNFQLIASDNSTQIPPNYQRVFVTNSLLNGCEVLVAEISSGDIVKDQYTISSTTSSTVVATGALDINKTPQSGQIKIGATRYSYTSFSGSTLSGVTPDPSSETGDFYIPLLAVTANATSENSDNIIYSSDIDVRTVVRKYGLRPFTQDTVFGANGLNFSPILTNDPQAT